MLHKVKDYVTFGKISDQMLQKLLEKRGRVGKMRLKEAMKQLGYPSVDALAKDINSGKKTGSMGHIIPIHYKRLFSIKNNPL